LGRPHNDAARRIAQYRLSLDESYCLGFSRAIVSAKLQGQLDFIRERLATDAMHRYPLTTCDKRLTGMIDQIDAQDSIASLRGIEGAAAAAYFEAMAEILPESLHFCGRNRQPPRDPVNAILSLTYTLLHAEAVLSLYGTGLDPFIGFYHALSFGRESLACDLMEALRPQADRFVLALFRQGTLGADDFSKTDGACLLGKAGRSRYYAAYESQAENFRRQLAESSSDIANAVSQHPGNPAAQKLSHPDEEEFA
jgi:CRISPR-associated protein Cas1